jgi:hypothetical protein
MQPMLPIWIEKVENNCMIRCHNEKCNKSPLYIDKNGYIISNTTVAIVQLSHSNFGSKYYCEDCIDQLYDWIKTKLDKRLWIFQ